MLMRSPLARERRRPAGFIKPCASPPSRTSLRAGRSPRRDGAELLTARQCASAIGGTGSPVVSRSAGGSARIGSAAETPPFAAAGPSPDLDVELLPPHGS